MCVSEVTMESHKFCKCGVTFFAEKFLRLWGKFPYSNVWIRNARNVVTVHNFFSRSVCLLYRVNIIMFIRSVVRSLFFRYRHLIFWVFPRFSFFASHFFLLVPLYLSFEFSIFCVFWWHEFSWDDFTFYCSLKGKKYNFTETMTITIKADIFNTPIHAHAYLYCYIFFLSMRASPQSAFHHIFRHHLPSNMLFQSFPLNVIFKRNSDDIALE